MWMSRWYARLVVLAFVVVIPFLGFLISNRYPLLRAETGVAVALLLVTCGALTAMARGFTFYLATLACGCVIATVPLQRALSPVCRLPVPVVAAGLVLAAGGLMLWLRERFFGSLVVFSVGTFAAHCILMLGNPGASDGDPQTEPGRRPPAHFLYLVLDGHMGPGGLPASVPECTRAAITIENTFGRYGFRLYPYAFSNYASTLDSLPSILNRKLPRRRQMLLRPGSPDPYGVHFVNADNFFSEFRARGYSLVVLQYHGLNFTGDEAVRVVEYSGELGALANTSLAWHEKLRVVVGNYQGSDAVLARFKGLFPLFRFGRRLVGPISVATVWPSRLSAEIAAARVPTFFFAYLLTPHPPYLYRRDGSVRRLDEWAMDESYDLLGPEPYRERYARYAEQIEFVQSQLDQLLSTLRKRGLLDRMTIVVHGDHGSRIRLRGARISGESGQADRVIDRYDYSGTPYLRDLLDRFCTLLAIKLPGERISSTIRRKESVLCFLSEVVYCRDASLIGPGVDSVFLFDERANAKEVRLLDLWKE